MSDRPGPFKRVKLRDGRETDIRELTPEEALENERTYREAVAKMPLAPCIYEPVVERKERSMEERNAVIERTMLGFEDHGIFTFVLHMNYGGSFQGGGMICLSVHDKETDKQSVHPRTGQLIADVLRTLERDTWEKLPGTSCRVRCDDGWNGVIREVGHYLKNKWVKLQVKDADSEAKR